MFNTNEKLFQLHHGEKKLQSMIWRLCPLIWISIVQDHWNNISRVMLRI